MKNKRIVTMGILFLMLNLTLVSMLVFTSSKAVAVFANSSDEYYNLDIFDGIVFEQADLYKYTVYGTHLNLNIKVSNEEKLRGILDSKIVFRNNNGNDVEYDIDYKISDDEILFSTSENINTGINLEKIDIENYYIMLKITTKEIQENGEEKLVDYYYNIVNDTEYDNLQYYTITRENLNKKIIMCFDAIPNKGVSTLNINVESCELPENVYDIVIDPGHGGPDEGASGNGYTESEITLRYALILKEKFESLGLKVKLTRDENETQIVTYGDGGRYVIANEVKAKLLLSVHLNSSNSVDVKGVEIYSPNNSDLTFSKNLAKVLVEKAKASYSPNNEWKKDDGVYVRTFSNEEIEELIEYANEYGFEPYEVTNNTSNYGVIREAGGICTGAYVDGRNSNYGQNLYYNSNIGVETYLLELGYISNKEELMHILANVKIYTDLIVLNTKEYLEL